MNKEEKFNILCWLFYRIFCCIFFEAIGFSFLLMPRLAKSVDNIVLKGAFEGMDFGFSLPVIIILSGLGILIGIFDWCLAYALRLQKALKKAKQG